MGSVEGFTKRLFGFKQFPVPKAYEAGKIPGRVNMISVPIYQYTFWDNDGAPESGPDVV